LGPGLIPGETCFEVSDTQFVQVNLALGCLHLKFFSELPRKFLETQNAPLIVGHNFRHLAQRQTCQDVAGIAEAIHISYIILAVYIVLMMFVTYIISTRYIISIFCAE